MARDVNLAVLEERGAETQPLWNNSPVVWIAVVYALFISLLEFFDVLGLSLWGVSSNIDRIERHVGFSTDALARAPFILLTCFMVFLAYQLMQKKLAALFLLSGLLFLQSSILVVRQRQLPAGIVALILSLLLLYFRQEFPARPDRQNLKKLKLAIPGLVAFFFVYGTVGLWLLHGNLDLAANPKTLLNRTVTVVFSGNSGVRFQGWETLFHFSLVLLGLIGLIWITATLFRPHRFVLGQSEEEHRRAHELMKHYGSDTIAYFNLRHDKNLFFLDDEIFLAYRCIGGTALVTGDPVGPPELVPEIMARFHNYCVEQGWRLTGLGVEGRHLETYRKAGLQSRCCGEEAVIHLDDFTLQGRKNKTLRHAVAKWDKHGAAMEFMRNASIPSHLKYELAQLSADWRGDTPETGFSMSLGRLMNSEDPDCLLAIAYDAGADPIGFTYLVPVYPRMGYSLDVTRIAADAPNGLNEFIFAKTAQFLKDQGYKCMSLHFAAFSQHYRKDRKEKGSRVVRVFSRAVNTILPVTSLYDFDRKFQPRWKQRYLLFENYLDLPRLALAVIATESYVQLMKIRRGSHGA